MNAKRFLVSAIIIALLTAGIVGSQFSKRIEEVRQENVLLIEKNRWLNYHERELLSREHALAGKKESAKRAIQDRKETKRELEKKQAKLSKTLDRLEKDLKSVQESIQVLEEKKDELQEQLADAEDSKSDLQKTLDKLKKREEDLREKISEVKR